MQANLYHSRSLLCAYKSEFLVAVCILDFANLLWSKFLCVWDFKILWWGYHNKSIECFYTRLVCNGWRWHGTLPPRPMFKSGIILDYCM